MTFCSSLHREFAKRNRFFHFFKSCSLCSTLLLLWLANWSLDHYQARGHKSNFLLKDIQMSSWNPNGISFLKYPVTVGWIGKSGTISFGCRNTIETREGKFSLTKSSFVVSLFSAFSRMTFCSSLHWEFAKRIRFFHFFAKANANAIGVAKAIVKESFP